MENAEGWKFEEIEKDNELQLVSTTNDPKLFLSIEPNVEHIYIDIEISSLFKDENIVMEALGEIYYAREGIYSSDQKIDLKFKRGHNIVEVPVNNMYSDFRIDLVAESGITVVLKEVNISNYFKIEWLFKIVALAFVLDIIVMALVLIPSKRTKLEEILDDLLIPVKNLYREFKNYLKDNRTLMVWTFFIVVLCYGLLCTYYTIYIDEERQIMAPYASQGWIAQGRFGNYFFERYLLTGKIYTSFLGDAIAAVLLGISALIQCFNFDKISGKAISRLSQMVFSGIVVSVPYICGAYMVVGIYNIEISLAICLTNLSISFILEKMHNCKKNYIYSVMLLAAGFSIYQAFVPLFITNTVICCILWFEFSEDIEFKKMFVLIRNSILVCLSALVIYYVLNQIFIMYIGGSSNYLSDSFIGWGKGEDVVGILCDIFAKIGKVITGSESIVWGGIVYKATFGFAGIYAIVRFIRINKRRGLFVFLLWSSLLAPFCMNFVIGSTMFAGRTLLGLPSLMGVIWILVIEKLSDKKFVRRLIYCIAFYLIFLQIQYINQYFLFDYKRYQQDQIITQEVISDIREACAGYTQMPIVLVGTYYHEENGLIMPYELAGSFYTVDKGNIVRMIRFMQAQGYNVDMPTPEQIADSYGHLEDMPSWPVKGSVKNIGGYVIVKLSEPSQAWIDSYVTSFHSYE